MENVVLGTRVPKQMDSEILKAVEEGKYLNKSDFLRVAVRSELKKLREG